MALSIAEAMQPVCAENRVEHAVMSTKKAAQACDTGGGQGTQRPQNRKQCGVGPPSAFRADVKPSRHFSGVRNPVFGADGMHRVYACEIKQSSASVVRLFKSVIQPSLIKSELRPMLRVGLVESV